MARITSVRKILLPGMLAYASLAWAQQAPTQQAPNAAPPKLERVDEGTESPLTQQRSGAKINEKREGGRVTEVEVTTGKSSYTMKGVAPGAVAQTGDAAGSTLRPPQWKVLEFDLSKKKQKEGENTGAATADAPPPAAIQK